MKGSEHTLFNKVWNRLYSTNGTPDKDVSEAIDRMYHSLKEAEPDLEEVWEKVAPAPRKKLPGLIRYAAVIIPVMVIAGSICLWLGTDNSSIAPSGGTITLTLGDGSVIDLEDPETISLLREAIPQDDGGLAYTENTASGMVSVEAVYHTLDIPRTKNYRLTLSDGTVVWLNSETRIHYPVIMGSNERKITLERGEAFFEVTSDPDRPFRVDVGGSTVEVLGTSFNISAYPEKDGAVYTTLTQGSVKMSCEDNSVVLSPGQQARFSAGSLRVNNVDLREYVSWRDGQYIFDRKTLGEIAAQLERWYNIPFRFEMEELALSRVTGMIEKDSSLEEIFGLLEMIMDVKFKMTRNEVIIRQKKR